MSRKRSPPTISNGTRWSADGARPDSSTTTLTRSVSSTAHVMVSVKFSPTRTALRSVFHQHSIGGTTTAAAFGGIAALAGAIAGRAGGGGRASRRIHRLRRERRGREQSEHQRDAPRCANP